MYLRPFECDQKAIASFLGHGEKVTMESKNVPGYQLRPPYALLESRQQFVHTGFHRRQRLAWSG